MERVDHWWIKSRNDGCRSRPTLPNGPVRSRPAVFTEDDCSDASVGLVAKHRQSNQSCTQPLQYHPFLCSTARFPLTLKSKNVMIFSLPWCHGVWINTILTEIDVYLGNGVGYCRSQIGSHRYPIKTVLRVILKGFIWTPTYAHIQEPNFARLSNYMRGNLQQDPPYVFILLLHYNFHYVIIYI